MRKNLILAALLLCACTNTIKAQQASLADSLQNIPSKYYSDVDKKLSSVSDKLTRKSLKYLARFQKQEENIDARFASLNPGSAVTAVSGGASSYTSLTNSIKSNSGLAGSIVSGAYNPNLDSLGASLSFLKQFNGITDKVKDPLKNFDELQGKLQQAGNIQAFIAERKNQIQQLLSKYTTLPAGLKNEYAKLNKTAYYYSAQVQEYKAMLKDPDKMEQKAMSVLDKIPAFQKFMKENSQLGNLFGVPSNYASTQGVQGLQTLDQVQRLISSRIGSGPNATQMLQSQMQTAIGSLNKFKDKLNMLGGGSGDIEMPNFKPNNQKTKPFLQRLEYGSNIQTTRGSYGFPTTSDLGLSVGYKLNNKATIGIGASYKTGWGKDIQHIHVSTQGMGLRSFAEYKIKKTFYATGGWEYNYQPVAITPLIKVNPWQPSGLIGITKTIEVKSKVFKKTSLQLLWDFMSYYQPIKTQALKFRLGYNF